MDTVTAVKTGLKLEMTPLSVGTKFEFNGQFRISVPIPVKFLLRAKNQDE